MQRGDAPGSELRVERELCLLPRALGLGALGAPRCRGFDEAAARIVPRAELQPSPREQRPLIVSTRAPAAMVTESAPPKLSLLFDPDTTPEPASRRPR